MERLKKLIVEAGYSIPANTIINTTIAMDNILSRREALRILGIGTAAFLNACKPKPVDLPATPEAQPVTSATLFLITENGERNELIESLPLDRPEAKNADDINVFSMIVGEKEVRCVMYEMSEKAVNEGLTIVEKDANGNTLITTQTVALFTEIIDDDTTSHWVRLTGVNNPIFDAQNIPTGESDTVWYYDPLLTAGTTDFLSKGIPVLQYDVPNAKNIIFKPILQKNGLIPNYDGNTNLIVKVHNQVPGAMKVLAAPVKELPNPKAQIEKTLKDLGIDIESFSNARVEEDGLHITNSSNEEFIFTLDQVAKQLSPRRDKVVQIFTNESKNEVQFAFDTVKNEVIQKSDWLFYPDPEEYPKNKVKKMTAAEMEAAFKDKLKVVTPEELPEMFRRENLLFKEFPLGTFQPDPEMINLQYGMPSIFRDQRPSGKYSPESPLGSSSLLNVQNMFLLKADPEKSRAFDTVIFSETIAVGDTFGTMHFSYDLDMPQSWAVIGNYLGGKTIVPVLAIPYDGLNSWSNLRTFRQETRNNPNLIKYTENGNVYFIFGDEMIKTFEEGKLSDILAQTIMEGVTR